MPDAPDPYALPSEATQEPPRTWWRALRKIGPGLILAGSIVGTGELIATTGLGAKHGYILLWLILLSCVIKVFVQTELGRYAITHGKTSLAAFDTLPGPRLGASWLVWLWLAMMLTTQAQIAAMEGLIGQAATLAFPNAEQPMAFLLTSIVPSWGVAVGRNPDCYWATLTTLAAILLLLSGGYQRLEKITTALVALVTLLTVASVVGLAWTKYPVRPDQVVRGLAFLVPATGIAAAFSAFGITGVGASELFAYPYWCLEKGYARATGPRPKKSSATGEIAGAEDDGGWTERARGWLWVMRVDAWFSMLVFTVATIAFYLLGAAVLHPQGLDPKGRDMIVTLSRMYVDAIGPWTMIVFLVGAWAVLFKTLYVATAANSRLTADFLALTRIWPQADAAARVRVIRAFCVFYPCLALGLYYLWREPAGLVKIGGYAQGLMLPLIAGATLYLRYRDADPRVAPSRASDALLWVAFLAILVVAAYSVVDLIRSA